MNIAYIILRILIAAVEIVCFLMIVRALFSWIPVPQAFSGAYRVIYNITEPMITPFRKLFYRSKWALSCPIDLSFTLAFVVLIVVERLLQRLLYYVAIRF